MRSAPPQGPARASAARTLLGHALAAARAARARAPRGRRPARARARSPRTSRESTRRRSRRPGRGSRAPAARSVACGARRRCQADADRRQTVGRRLRPGLRRRRRHRRRRPAARRRTLRELLEAHHADGNAVTVLTAELADPTGYGRILRDARRATCSASSSRRTPTPTQRADHARSTPAIYAFDAASCAARSAGSAATTRRARCT